LSSERSGPRQSGRPLPSRLVVLALAVAVGVSAFFVPYPELARRVIHRARPFKLKDLQIDANDYQQFFQAGAVELDGRKKVITIVCKTLPAYPKTRKQMSELWESSADSPYRRLAIEALTRNCLRCELFDRDGNFKTQKLCYMHWTADEKEFFTILIPFDRYLERVRITY